jgi:hypothetical protein
MKRISVPAPSDGPYQIVCMTWNQSSCTSGLSFGPLPTYLGYNDNVVWDYSIREWNRWRGSDSRAMASEG